MTGAQPFAVRASAQANCTGLFWLGGIIFRPMKDAPRAALRAIGGAAHRDAPASGSIEYGMPNPEGGAFIDGGTIGAAVWKRVVAVYSSRSSSAAGLTNLDGYRWAAWMGACFWRANGQAPVGKGKGTETLAGLCWIAPGA